MRYFVMAVVLVVLAILIWPLAHRIAAAYKDYEEPRYSLLESEGDFEVRRYAPLIVAETTVEGDFEDAGNKAFRILAAYIGGENRKKQSIAMTAPVNQQRQSEQIAMTVPVNQQRKGSRWRFTFVMPANYTLETLPEPLDKRTVLKEEPARLVAAHRYSGFWSRERYEKKKTALLTWMKERGLKPVGEPIFARYNDPFTLWFLRRNEVLIPIERSGG